MNNLNKKDINFAAIAIDIVVFGIQGGKLHVLLDTVDRPPHYTNIDAFIGGLVDVNETADDAVARHLNATVSLKKVYTEQLYTFSEINRDKRGRVISISYHGLIQPDVMESCVQGTSYWCPVSKLPKLAYDHDDIYRVAINRLRGKLEYTTIAQNMLSKHFTLTELQEVYELVLGKDFDKRNFRKKILSLDIVKETGEMQDGVKNRPAALYAFKDSKLKELSVFV